MVPLEVHCFIVQTMIMIIQGHDHDVNNDQDHANDDCSQCRHAYFRS